MNKSRRTKLTEVATVLSAQYEILGEIQADEQEAFDCTPETFEDKRDEMQAVIDDLDNIITTLDQVISDINDLV